MKLLWQGGPVYADDPTFKITTDSVLLAHFASGLRGFSRCMDLGCGGGLLSVLLHDRFPDAVFDSVDIRPAAVKVCEQNYQANHINGFVDCADARTYRTLGNPGEYDLVVCNPPYYYAGKGSPDESRAAARPSSGEVFPA